MTTVISTPVHQLNAFPAFNGVQMWYKRLRPTDISGHLLPEKETGEKHKAPQL